MIKICINSQLPCWTVDTWGWISNFISHLKCDYLSMLGLKWIHVSKMGPNSIQGGEYSMLPNGHWWGYHLPIVKCKSVTEILESSWCQLCRHWQRRSLSCWQPEVSLVTSWFSVLQLIWKSWNLRVNWSANEFLWHDQYIPYPVTGHSNCHQGPRLLTWFNFNPSMGK